MGYVSRGVICPESGLKTYFLVLVLLGNLMSEEALRVVVNIDNGKS
jgi:hypothetical protein